MVGLGAGELPALRPRQVADTLPSHMAIFLTGATGYLGSYLLDRFLRADARVTALVRATDPAHARERLWQALQLHLSADALAEHLASGRLRFVLGDLRRPRLGLSEEDYALLVAEHDTVVHAAATLNRRSARACFDVNLRGGMTVLQLARAIRDAGGLRRYTHVSTVAIAGRREGEDVEEDSALDWDRSDFDPYARTKKFGEHLVHELLPEASVVIGRPSIVLGDSRFPDTTQFDMARAFVGLGRLPVLPFAPDLRLDIVNADFVADALVALTLSERPLHRVYHLSSGQSSPTFRQVTQAMVEGGAVRRAPRFAPRFGRPTAALLGVLSNLRALPGAVRGGAALMDVFWPYLEWDVVFRNERVVSETGLAPTSFLRHCAGLHRYCVEGGFRYPFRALPPVVADARLEFAQPQPGADS
jgi:thioester reductase-like protein